MFCPKCGTNNPDDGKFCRSCGTDLGNVSAALAPNNNSVWDGVGLDSCDTRGRRARRTDPDEVYADGVRAVVSGIGFLIVSALLFYTGVAGGRAWWWAMLFPAFTFLSKGISDLVKSRRMERARGVAVTRSPVIELNSSRPAGELPYARTQFVSPESRYKTGDLVPPSVTDETTRHLKIDDDNETMTLPKL